MATDPTLPVSSLPVSPGIPDAAVVLAPHVDPGSPVDPGVETRVAVLEKQFEALIVRYFGASVVAELKALL